MAHESPKRIRNVALVGHRGSGKTSVMTWTGSMLPRKTNGALRNCAGILGLKFEKTPRWVSNVSATFKSWR